MTNIGIENIGFGILSSFFGIYDEKVMEETKLHIGKYVIEKGGVEKVLEENFKTAPIGTPKEQIVEALNECKELAIAKGVINVKD